MKRSLPNRGGSWVTAQNRIGPLADRRMATARQLRIFIERPSAYQGATLVEVVLAIGVLSIVSLAIWGGLTVGMQRTNDLRNMTETAQIRDYLLSQIQGGTNTVTNLPTGIYYFDDQGLQLTGSSTPWAYSAQMSLVSSTGTVSLPNASANTNLLSVKIQLQSHSGGMRTNYYYFVTP